MKYGLGVIAVLILIGLAGFYMYSNSQKNTYPEVEDKSKMEGGDKMDKPGDNINDGPVESSKEAMMEKGGMTDKMSKGQYIPYSKEALETDSSNKRVLFFFANWCPTCLPVDADLTKNTSKIPEGVTIFRVNYNDTETDANEKQLAQKYAVTYQHTFVQIDSEGKEVVKWNGGGLDKIKSSLE